MDGFHDYEGEPKSVEERLREIGFEFGSEILEFKLGEGHFHAVDIDCTLCGERIAHIGVISSPHGSWSAMLIQEFIGIMGLHIAHVITKHTKGFTSEANTSLVQGLMRDIQGFSGLN